MQPRWRLSARFGNWDRQLDAWLTIAHRARSGVTFRHVIAQRVTPDQPEGVAQEPGPAGP
jgi:hypothetical protein